MSEHTHESMLQALNDAQWTTLPSDPEVVRWSFERLQEFQGSVTESTLDPLSMEPEWVPMTEVQVDLWHNGYFSPDRKVIEPADGSTPLIRNPLWVAR